MNIEKSGKKYLIGLLVMSLWGCGDQSENPEALENEATHTPTLSTAFSHVSHEDGSGDPENDLENDTKDDTKDDPKDKVSMEEKLNQILQSILSLNPGEPAYKSACVAFFNKPVVSNDVVWQQIVSYGIRNGWRFSPYLFGVFAGSNKQSHGENLLRGLCRATPCPAEDEFCMHDCIQDRGAEIAHILQGDYAQQAKFVQRISARLLQTYASASRDNTPPSSDSSSNTSSSPDSSRNTPPSPTTQRVNGFRAMRANKSQITGSSSRKNAFETCMTYLEHALEGTDENEARQCFGILKKPAYAKGFIGIEEKWGKHVIEGFLTHGNSEYAQKALEILFTLNTQEALVQQTGLLEAHEQLHRVVIPVS